MNKKKISTEKLILGLFCIGFKEVSSLLYTLTLGYLATHRMLDDFSFDDTELSSSFHKYFTFDGVSFKFRNGYTLSSKNIWYGSARYPSLGVAIKYKEVIDLLNLVDFEEIQKKAKSMIE